MEETNNILRVLIIGSGPAGYTAAIYTSRAELKPVLYEGFMAGGIAAGGQLTTTTEVENFPGFPEGISGPELMMKIREQAQKFGTEIHTETISRADLSSRPFKFWREGMEDEAPLQAHSVIIATGATAKRMGLPGEEKYWQRGMSACAVCDGALPIFRNRPIAVIGGGDSAVEDAIYLTRYASVVYLVHRRDELRASRIMAERAISNPKIKILWNHVAESVDGDGTKLGILRVKNVVTGEGSDLEVSGLFYAIGHKPNTELFQGQVALDEDGYIVTQGSTSLTNIEGVFAAGDVHDKRYRQAITAAGSGCRAALDAERWLTEQDL